MIWVCAVSSVGPMRVEFNIPVTLEQIKKDNPSLQPGGRFRPGDCEALQKVAIIIPFRKRDEHLKFWLYYLHPILQRQQLDYGVYVVNQVPRHNTMLSLVLSLHAKLRSIAVVCVCITREEEDVDDAFRSCGTSHSLLVLI